MVPKTISFWTRKDHHRHRHHHHHHHHHQHHHGDHDNHDDDNADDVDDEDDDDDVVADDGDGNLMSELHASPVPRNTHRPHLCNTPNTYIYM